VAAMEEPRRRELGATLGARVRKFDGDRSEERAQGDKEEREARLRAGGGRESSTAGG
jgi:hypothetical protein